MPTDLCLITITLAVPQSYITDDDAEDATGTAAATSPPGGNGGNGGNGANGGNGGNGANGANGANGDKASSRYHGLLSLSFRVRGGNPNP